MTERDLRNLEKPALLDRAENGDQQTRTAVGLELLRRELRRRARKRGEEEDSAGGVFTYELEKLSADDLLAHAEQDREAAVWELKRRRSKAAAAALQQLLDAA